MIIYDPQLLTTQDGFYALLIRMEPMGKADRALDALWRGLYGQPLPLRGAPELALRIIIEKEKPPWSSNPADVVPPGR